MVQGLPQIHYRPRQGATYEPSLDVLVPALSRLRACHDSLKTLVLLDSLPDLIIPALAFAASQKTYIPAVAVKTIIKYCGPIFLERTLGGVKARMLQARYKHEALSGL